MQNALEEYINGKIRRLQEVLTFHNGYYEEVETFSLSMNIDIIFSYALISTTIHLLEENTFLHQVLEPFDKRCLDTFIMVPVMTPEV